MKVVVSLLVVAALLATVQATPVPTTTTKCTACKYVITVIDHWLAQGKTVEEIKTLISDFCALLGMQYAEICNAILDGEIEEIIKLIEQKSPEEVCKYLKICTADQVDDTKCDLCKFGIDLVEAFLTDQTTDDQIIKFLENLCKQLSFAKLCDQIVEYGMQEFVKLLREKLGPEVVCKAIKLCA